MAAPVKVEIDQRQLRALRKRVDDAVSDLRARGVAKPLLEEIKTQAQRHIREMFRSGGRKGKHGRWASYQRHERKYAAIKRRMTGSAYPIFGWGRGRSQLIDSWTKDTHRLSDTRIIGDTLWFGSKHPASTPEPLPKWARMRGQSIYPPVRRLWDPKPETERRMYQAALDFYDDLLRKYLL